MGQKGRFSAFMGYPTQDQSWRERAECKGQDPSLWFPGVGESSKKIHLAAAICEQCPVQEECLDYALKTKQQFGMWGGLLIKDRRKVNRKNKNSKTKN